MANSNRPFGFKPVACPGKVGIPMQRYLIAASNQAFAKGDLLEKTNAGTVDRYKTSTTGASAMSTTNVCVGVCHCVEYIDSAGVVKKEDYCPASVNGGGSTAYVYVYDDPDTEFEVQCGYIAANAISQTVVGQTAEAYYAAPSQVGAGGHSNQVLDNNTLSTTAQLLTIVRLSSALENTYSTTEASSRYARVIVRVAMNKHIAPASGVAPGI